MSEYRVNLDVFAGPLDLLLYLVRKEEVDIYDIPITRIADQYIHYIDMLKQFDIDLAGSFLVMAATLMQIKSAMLLPKVDAEDIDGEDPTDPRSELIRQLLEYKKFKDAANMLKDAAQARQDRFTRPNTIIENLKDSHEPELDLENVSVWDLLEAFDRILKETGGHHFDVSHIIDDTPIDLYQVEILHQLQSEGPMKFSRIFESRKKERIVMVGLFLAILELVRDKLVWVEQDQASKDIFIKPLTEDNPEEAVKNAMLANIEELSAEQTEEEDESVGETQAVAGEKAEVPIEIVEIPASTKTAKEPVLSEDTPIAIMELPAKQTSDVSAEQEMTVSEDTDLS